MGPDSDRLQELAGSVADGLAVDWEAAARDARDDEERRLVENLRRLQSLGAASRGRATPPAVWQGLRLREPLGHGAFGDVFSAWDPKLQRDVALKLVPLTLGAIDAPALEEGRLLARVRHSHVVAVHGADVSEGWAGLWMERIRGQTLAAIVSENGPLGHWDLGLVALDVSRALAAVHAAGILHCDVKPSNVMREEGERTVLMDFGIGRRAGTAQAATAGTPAFMAPETLRGEPATVRSDVYMVGALLYALGTGRPPVRTASASLRSLRPDIPERFAGVVDRALDLDPGRRFPSADAMAAALSEALGAPERGRRGRRRLVVLAAALVAASLVALWAGRPRPNQPAERWERTTAAPPAFSGPAGQQPLAAAPPGAPAGRLADNDPFVPPVGSRAPLSDASDPGSSAARPFSIRAAWHPHEPVPEIELRASRPLCVYVLREERPSHSFLLFPLPGAGPPNPLSGEKTHRLRIRARDGPRPWRLLVVASPSPLPEFEAAVERSRVPRQEIELSGIRLTEEALAALRQLEPAGAGTGSRRPLFESAPPLASHPEIVQGPWVRVLDAGPAGRP